MEDYDKFVKHQRCRLRKKEEESNTPPPASSLIRFYGRAILPPLLSGDQKEDMQRHRDAAQKAAIHIKLTDVSRMNCVQTILQSVQLRKTPTLEELLQESDFKIQSSYSNTSDVLMSKRNFIIETKDDLSAFTLPERKVNDVSLPPFTSTTNSAFFDSIETSQQEGYLRDSQYTQKGSQKSSLNGQSHLSSGYVTSENVKNITSYPGRMDECREIHGLSYPEDAYSAGGFFLNNTSNTIAKMPDIISYPPIDGEELERSGLESYMCKDNVVVNDIFSSSLDGDSIICENLPGGKPECSQEECTEVEAKIYVTNILELYKEHSFETIEDQVSGSKLLESHPHSHITELHTEPDPTETDNTGSQEDKEVPSEEPYRFSLQALLKKSQEYRRRQRMLRNQAKNSKIHERTQEQPKTRAEEQSLSDKENEDSPLKGSMMTESKKTKDRRGIPSSETLEIKASDNDRRIYSKISEGKKNLKTESIETCLAKDENMKEISKVQLESDKINKVNISPDVLTEPKQMRAFTHQQLVMSETSPEQLAFGLSTSPVSFYEGLGKYQSIPVPTFCQSPVHCKSKRSVQEEETVDTVETSKTFAVKSFDENDNLGRQNSCTVSLMAGVDPEEFSTRSSQHIDQLESNLSGLKVLISDLESTLTENFRNQTQTENKLIQSVHEDDDTCKGAQDQRELGGQSLHNFQNMLQNAQPSPCVSDSDDVPIMEEEKETGQVDQSEPMVLKSLVTEREKERGSCKDRLTKCYQQPPVKFIRSLTQHLQIPDMFRNNSSENAAPHHISLLSETSNHPGDTNEVAVEGHYSSCSPSLNESYDVDAPSGLWLPDVTATDLGTKGQNVQKKHLPPESEGGAPGGVSKVKRKLLMHASEETLERSADVSGEESSLVRPDSSSPKAGVRWNGGNDSYKDKQNQLRLAHAAQVRALQDEHRRQQEDLLQALAVRFSLLQSVSVPCSMSGSRLGDTLTFTSLSQPSSSPSERCRPLLSAAVKGFLTRRLLRTERVSQLVRTIRDTKQLLQALVLQHQSPGRGELCSRQDLLLQDRLALQLRAARYEVSDIFFNLSAGERMQMISWDRELARERELSRKLDRPRGMSSLSAATQKSLQRKRGMMIQKRAAGRPRGSVTSSAEQPLETKHGQFRANPQRVPKSTYSSRPR